MGKPTPNMLRICLLLSIVTIALVCGELHGEDEYTEDANIVAADSADEVDQATASRRDADGCYSFLDEVSMDKHSDMWHMKHKMVWMVMEKMNKLSSQVKQVVSSGSAGTIKKFGVLKRKTQKKLERVVEKALNEIVRKL